MLRNSVINERHGGDIQWASTHYGIELSEWLDLSTGIAPWSYPYRYVPDAVWECLPHLNDPLVNAASHYYRCPESCVLAVSGSQQAIAVLPELFESRTVAVPKLGYFEHHNSWAASHQVYEYSSLEELEQWVARGLVSIVVVINPNNPSAENISKNRLLKLAERLALKSGFLIVDEAFSDALPSNSLANELPMQGVLVLRSVGKFFGLAGLRLGFVLGDTLLIKKLQRQLPSWSVNGPAQYLGAKMLADDEWQKKQRQTIQTASGELVSILQSVLPKSLFEIKAAALFVSVFVSEALGVKLFEHLARQGVLIRRFELADQRYCLRFGLLKDAETMNRFKRALSLFTGIEQTMDMDGEAVPKIKPSQRVVNETVNEGA